MSRDYYYLTETWSVLLSIVNVEFMAFTGQNLGQLLSKTKDFIREGSVADVHPLGLPVLGQSMDANGAPLSRASSTRLDSPCSIEVVLGKIGNPFSRVSNFRTRRHKV